MNYAASWLNLNVGVALAFMVPTAASLPVLSQVKPVPLKSKAITVSEGTDMAATVSPDGKTVIIDLQGMLYSLPISGGQAKQLTGPLVEASHPEFSPDGSQVVLQSYQGGTFHIWLMKPDSTGLRQLTSGHGDDREPRFSPDGKMIAFASDRAFKGSYDIWTVDVESGALKQITTSENDEYEPTWSPDGKQIAYVNGVYEAGVTGVAAVQGRAIEAIDLATGTTHVVASTKGVPGRLEAPSWSKDGKLAYVQMFGSGNLVDSSKMMVDGDVVSDKYDDTFPFPAHWLSPTSLLYTANGKIVKVDLTAKTEVTIPFTAGIESIRPMYRMKNFNFDSTAAKQVKGILAPALSPDGKLIAFVALNELYLLDVGRSVPKALTHDSFYKQGPAWSPDGKWLAYVSDKGGVENIYLLNPATGEEKEPAPSKTRAEIFPAWSPDGKKIAFQDQTGATVMLDVATGATSPLAPATFFPGRPAFSTNGKTVSIATVKPYSHRFREGTSAILAVDLATKKTQWYEPAPFESISTRTEDGPVYSPHGNEMIFVMDDLLYAMPVDADGRPSGKAIALNNEITDAPTFDGSGKKILYLSNGKLRLMDRGTKAIATVPLDLTYKPEQPTDKILIHAARYWKGSGPEVLKDVDVLVDGHRVASVGPHTGKTPAGYYQVIEAPNSTVLPGLWENHAHPDSDASIYYGDRLGRLWMIYGITTLRDMADQAYRAAEQKEAFVSGTAVGPRLFATGEAIDGERTYYPMMIPTTSEAQLQREFERLKGLDFDFMKLYVRLPYSWVVKGVDFAHNQMGVQTAGHYLLPAVALGNDGMSHVSATARTGYAYSRTLTGWSYSDVRTLMEESGMWTTSTLLNQAIIVDSPAMADDIRYRVAVPWELDRLIKARDTAVQSSESTRQLNADRTMREEATVKGAIEGKGIVIGGTDSPLDLPSVSLHLNLREQVKYGLAPWQALETVTSVAARAAGVSKDLGTIEAGKLADLILVEGNPLTDIGDVTKVQCVMKNGKLMSVSAIMQPFVASSLGSDICPAQ